MTNLHSFPKKTHKKQGKFPVDSWILHTWRSYTLQAWHPYLQIQKHPKGIEYLDCLAGWWLNQPIWKICSSKWVHLPQLQMIIFFPLRSRHSWLFEKNKRKSKWENGDSSSPRFFGVKIPNKWFELATTDRWAIPRNPSDSRKPTRHQSMLNVPPHVVPVIVKN